MAMAIAPAMGAYTAGQLARAMGMQIMARGARHVVDNPVSSARTAFSAARSLHRSVSKARSKRLKSATSRYSAAAAPTRLARGYAHHGKPVKTLGRVGRFGGRKRPGRPGKDVARMRVDSVETHKQSGVAWIGYKSYHRGRLFNVVARRLWIKVMRRLGIQQINDTTVPPEFNTPPVARVFKVIWRFDPINVQGDAAGVQADHVEWEQITDGQSLSTLMAGLGPEMLAKAKEGYVLTSATVVERDMTIVHPTADMVPAVRFTLKNLNKYQLDFRCTTTYKIQNITTADDGGTSTTDISANPLSGVLYDFSHPTPRFRQQYLNETDGSGLSKLQDTSEETDYIDTSCLRAGDVFAAPLEPQFAQPDIRPTVIFKDCTSKAAVNMPPGGFSSFTRTFRFTGTLERLTLGSCHSYAVATGATYQVGGAPISDPVSYATTGDSVLLALDHTIRTLAPSLENVEVVINREQLYTCDVRPPKQKPMQRVTLVANPQHYGLPA